MNIAGAAQTLHATFLAHADEARAAQMQAYMKTEMPFYGVQAPQRKALEREFFAAHTPSSADEQWALIHAIWDLGHREACYSAISLARRPKRWVSVDRMDDYRWLIEDGAWWDLVDEVAQHLVGPAVQRAPELGFPTLDAWVDDPNLWLRRTAIIAQNRFKSATDATRLFRYALRRADEKEFFIRKAIGWALREYAYAAPDAVHAFLTENKNAFSGLTFREASRVLKADGWQF